MMRAFAQHQRAISRQLCSDGLSRAHTLGAVRGPAQSGLYSTRGAGGCMHAWGNVIASRHQTMSSDRKYRGGGLRGFGGSSYHFSAAEKDDSAILSDAPSDEDTGGATTTESAVAENREEANENVKALCEQILNLDVIEMNQLLFRLQARLGISEDMLVGGGVAVAGGSASGVEDAAAAAPAEEKTSFDVKLASFDAKSKLKIIKEVRAATSLPLKEAKELVEKAPAVVKEGLTKEEAEALKKVLTDLGGVVEID